MSLHSYGYMDDNTIKRLSGRGYLTLNTKSQYGGNKERT